MKVILDTHNFLWYIWGNAKLPVETRTLIDDPNNQIFLSIGSLWEIAIKVNIGKLKINKPLQVLVPIKINVLPIRLNHLETLISLPLHHRDPFDRIIISQAISEKLDVSSVDDNFRFYDINLI